MNDKEIKEIGDSWAMILIQLELIATGLKEIREMNDKTAKVLQEIANNLIYD